MNFIDITKYKAAKTERELERITEELLVTHFDKLKKEEWSKELSTQYNVSKKSKVVAIRKNKSNYLWAWSAAASLLLLIIALPFLTTSKQTSTQELVAMHTKEQYPLTNARKGSQNIAILQQERDKSYQDKNFPEAIKLGKQIVASDNADENDYFILGVSYFNNQNWAKAIEELELVSPKYKDTTMYYSIEWYLSLAYFQTTQEDKAIEIWQEFAGKNSSYSKRAEELLKAQ